MYALRDRTRSSNQTKRPKLLCACHACGFINMIRGDGSVDKLAQWLVTLVSKAESFDDAKENKQKFQDGVTNCQGGLTSRKLRTVNADIYLHYNAMIERQHRRQCRGGRNIKRRCLKSTLKCVCESSRVSQKYPDPMY
jgi:hypothetical protein